MNIVHLDVNCKDISDMDLSFMRNEGESKFSSH